MILTGIGDEAGVKLDAQIQAAHELGWKVLLTVTSPVPVWATAARKDQVTRPEGAQFKQYISQVYAQRNCQEQYNLSATNDDPSGINP